MLLPVRGREAESRTRVFGLQKRVGFVGVDGDCGCEDWDRTSDTLGMGQVLLPLSYFAMMVGESGVEPLI